MGFGRILLAWAAVGAWLAAWALAERRTGRARGPARRPEAGWLAGEALLLALFGALWFGSLGSGEWWLVFLLVGALTAWPVRTVGGAARIGRTLVAGWLLVWILRP